MNLKIAKVIAAVCCSLVITISVLPGCASKPAPAVAADAQPQESFASCDEAVRAFADAVKAHDTAALTRVLGPEGNDILNSGDEVDDRATSQRFLDAYNRLHYITYNDDVSATLVIGEQEWPLPIPIVKDATTGQWSFDTEAGKDEIVNRRIGRNELDVIQVCKAVVDAQQEYVQLDPDGDGVAEYARKIISDAGKRNGLYWPQAGPNDPASPLGELVADATAEGYGSGGRPASGEPRPYHGYYYRLLTAQGASAPGGAVDYVVNGKLVGGFALVAWPAEYGNSGIMTFITNYQGDVFQKDIGDNTDAQAKAMKDFDPDSSWTKAEEPATKP